jgi:hypothetical protein
MKDWFLAERGIKPETLEAFGVTTTDREATFPYGDAKKVRKHDADGKRHFYYDGPYAPILWGLSSGETAAFVVEGETDAMRLWQELGGEYSVYCVSGVEGWKDEFAETLAEYDRVYIILDNDPDYNVAARVEACWRSIRKAVGAKAMRIKLPKHTKDVCEFFQVFNPDALYRLAEDAASRSVHYPPLDLSKDPPPVDWLVESLVASGDVVVMIGEPNVGKSWLSMSLAAAVADNHGTWLGHAVRKHGRVLYIDEENPEDVVRHRLHKLGLENGSADNVRYIHQQGVRLDRYPEKILDEAIAFDPTLIVLDSLTRLHTQDENNAGAISALFNDAINPLARETGATVLLLHHVNKTDSGSSFIRARGSSDIGGSMDTGLDVRKAGGDKLHVVHFKSRRRQAGDVIQLQILDTPTGGVELAVSHNPVF